MVGLKSSLGLTILSLALQPIAVSGAETGYFDSEICVDPSGFEGCYADASASYSDCVNSNCEGKNIDCIHACACVQTDNQIDCAGTYCWNQVYGCEYQQTVGDATTFCANPRLEELPFTPPPNDAPGACSCNIAKILISQIQTNADTETCGSNGMEIQSQLTTEEDLDNWYNACLCCSYSAYLSVFTDVCPDVSPSFLGADQWYDFVTKSDEWPNCGPYMEMYPCDSTLGFTLPDSGTFYEPGNFPPEGTSTEVHNVGGSITSPVSGAVYTWTNGNIEHPITVASADAQPTAAAGSNGEGNSSDGDESSDDSESSDSNSDNSGDNKSDSNEAGTDGKKNGAPIRTPETIFAIYSSILLVMVL